MSDDVLHVTFVSKIIQEMIPEVKQTITDLNKVYIFAHGCAGQ